MPTQIQWRRGTTAQTASFTGALAEITVDTDKKVVVVHDGVTPGGWPTPQINFVDSSFNTANAANVSAQAAFNKANTANTTAQAGFDAANTKYNSSGGTISGDVIVTGNVTPTTDNVYSLGSQSYRWKDLYVGPGSVNIDNIVLSNTNGTLTISGASEIVVANSNFPSVGNVSQTANAAFDKANTANTTAQAGFNKANSANTLAQAGFDVANTKFNTSGGTISGSLTVTGNVVVEGNTTFIGNVTTVEVSTLNVADPLIYLAANNYTSDAVSIGFVGNYFNGANNEHAGVFRDPISKEFIIMGRYQPEIEANNLINIAHPTFAYSNVNASIFKGNLIANNAIVNGFDIFDYTSSAFSKANTDVTSIAISGGTFGNTTTIPTFTVEANGRISSVSSVSFTSGASITNETSSSSTFYPLFAATTSGTPSTIYVSSSKLSYVPSTGTITAVDLNTTSDIKYKENVKPIRSALSTVKKIEGVSFDWIETNSKSYGIIAQELQKILPELVHNTERGLSVSYLPIIAILIEAVKDQQKQIDKLKKQIKQVGESKE